LRPIGAFAMNVITVSREYGAGGGPAAVDLFALLAKRAWKRVL
jgi:hypothetical protein